MKARVTIEHPANVAKVDPQYRPHLKPVVNFYAGVPRTEWYWPVGVMVEGEKAVRLVRYGLAAAIDEECAKACGMSEEELARNHQVQAMAQLGIHSKQDQDLYLAGVIKGYKPKAGGGLEYDWGPNAEAYKKALAEAKQQEDIDE